LELLVRLRVASLEAALRGYPAFLSVANVRALILGSGDKSPDERARIFFVCDWRSLVKSAVGKEEKFPELEVR
jgi:hypothetical protein